MGRLSGPLVTFVVTAAIAGGVFIAAKRYADGNAGDVRNFAIEYGKPDGWKTIPHSPQTLFLFRHPETNLLMRGAQNQVVSDVNPTPDMHSEGVANFYIDTTKQNMKDWTAKKIESVEGRDVEFHLIDRARKGKRVISAFGVKGNTTLIVSLSGNDDEVDAIDAALPDFRKYLASIEFQPTQPDEFGRIVAR